MYSYAMEYGNFATVHLAYPYLSQDALVVCQEDGCSFIQLKCIYQHILCSRTTEPCNICSGPFRVVYSHPKHKETLLWHV